MKNLKNILAILVLSVALYSCDADVSMDDPQAATENISADTGDQGQTTDVRGDDD